MKQRAIMLVGVLAACGCPQTQLKTEERAWADVPPATGPASACTGESTQLGVCDWATPFEDLVVFGVDSIDAIEEPAFLNGSEVDASECELVAPAFRFSGETLNSSNAIATRVILMPPATYVRLPDEMLLGTKILLPVLQRGDELYGFDPIRVVDDRIDSVAASECQTSTAIVGRTVDDVLDELRGCTITGQGFALDTVTFLPGGQCVSPIGDDACSLESDCVGPAARCTEGRCSR